MSGMDRYVPGSEIAREERTARWTDRWARAGVLSIFERIEAGQVALVEGGKRTLFGAPGELSAQIHVLDPAFYAEALLGGTVGAGRSFMKRHWECDDPVALCRIFLQNREALSRADGGLSRLTAPLRRLLHSLRRNTRTGSRRNIEAHYDLGNEFFGLFLDPTLMYSCALFERPDMTLEEASTAKLERVCRRLELSAADHVVEIGSGWGGFALHAASVHGCRVTTTTLSREQHALASRRVFEAGLAERVRVLLRDYRDLDGKFDKLVSIEMIEAVGAEYYETYFEKCAELLRPGGRGLVQAILIRDDEFESARDSVDFIKHFIFPGSCIPSQEALRVAMRAAGRLEEDSVEDYTPHYVETLARWRAGFRAHLDRARLQGFGEDFLRMWEFYFCYCEAGFAERHTRSAHLTFHRNGKAGRMQGARR